MSVDATISTWKLQGISAIQKLLLLSLSDRADEFGYCWPSIKRLEADTLLNRKTLIENRQLLIASGHISYTGELKGSRKQIPVMKLNYVAHREGKINTDSDEFFTSTENGTGPKNGIDKKFTSPENGIDKKFTSPENGTGTSPENGTLNLSVEPFIEPATTSMTFEEYKNEEKMALNDSLIVNNQSQLKEKFKTEALNDSACNDTYNSRFNGIEVTLIQLYEECCDYWSQKNQMVYKARFLTHLKKTPIDKYKTGSSASKYPTKEQRDAEYKKIEQREKESEQRRQQDIDRSAKVKNIDKRKEITQKASSALSSCLNALRQ